MNHSSSQLPAPGRLFLPGCAIAAGLLAVSSPLHAAPLLKSRPKVAALKVAALSAAKPMQLSVGKTATFPLARNTNVNFEQGREKVVLNAENECLNVKGVRVGLVQLRLSAPGRPPQVIRINWVGPRDTTVVTQTRPPLEGATPSTDTTVAPASPTSGQTPDVSPSSAITDGQTSALPSVPDTVPNTVPSLGLAPATSPNPTLTDGGTVAPSTPTPGDATASGQSPLSPDLTGQAVVPTPPAPPLPSLSSPDGGVAFSPAPRPARTNSTPTTPTRRVPVRPTPSAPRISPILPAPARSARANVTYRTAPRLPQNVVAGGARQSINVTQGLARLISFPSNILAVFFSNPGAMDARAINARTIAVTGVGPGPSTLAVFTSQFPGDAVGRANIYRIQTTPPSGSTGIIEPRDPRVVAEAITAALGDPRVRAVVYTKPDDGTLFARLSGSVRNVSEVEAAKTTASFFVPAVVSSLYADANAPTLEAVMSGAVNVTPTDQMQENLRHITGNDSIELVPMGTGMGLKAEVGSTEEAEALMRVLPSLDQQIMPFIVVRGQESNARYYNAKVPFLQGEDRQLTQKLHDVTGISTVYAARTASNSLACYGTVRTRTEFDKVRRYMNIMAQSSVPPSVQGTSQGGSTLRPQGREGAALPNYDPSAGYARNLGLQMFVEITDPGESVIRKVTVETSVVEISRTAMRNLGVEVGTVSVLNETVTGGGTTNANGVTTTSPVVTTRTIDPTFNQGTVLAGTGFAGGQSLGNINPFRVRLNALISNGDARVLSSPNVSSIEGASAQITIGGERPVPKAVATQGAVGTQIEFRRFGVIISMRPTVTNNDTIILQIRADITQPDRTFEINLNGALIPGETVRSVDTTLNVRAGDTVVMGGLITNERRQQTSKVPILGDIPLLGSLFRSRRFENNETELAIFMMPHLEKMPADGETINTALNHLAFPPLPSLQEAGAILFQDTTRSAG